MRTPTPFKYLLCCRLLIAAALALPTPAQTTVVTSAGLSEPAAVSNTPSSPVTPLLPPPPADNTLQALMTPTALDEQAQSSALSAALTNEPVAVVAPEPSALLLLAIGIGLLWLIRRKR